MKLTVIHSSSLRISGVEIVLFSLTRSVIVVLSQLVCLSILAEADSRVGPALFSETDRTETDSCRLSSNAIER